MSLGWDSSHFVYNHGWANLKVVKPYRSLLTAKLLSFSMSVCVCVSVQALLHQVVQTLENAHKQTDNGHTCYQVHYLPVSL